MVFALAGDSTTTSVLPLVRVEISTGSPSASSSAAFLALRGALAFFSAAAAVTFFSPAAGFSSSAAADFFSGDAIFFLVAMVFLGRRVIAVTPSLGSSNLSAEEIFPRPLQTHALLLQLRKFPKRLAGRHFSAQGQVVYMSRCSLVQQSPELEAQLIHYGLSRRHLGLLRRRIGSHREARVVLNRRRRLRAKGLGNRPAEQLQNVPRAQHGFRHLQAQQLIRPRSDRVSQISRHRKDGTPLLGSMVGRDQGARAHGCSQYHHRVGEPADGAVATREV